MAYCAPIEELLFTMAEVVGTGRLGDLPGFAGDAAEAANAILDEAGRFAQDILAPLNRSGDRQGCRLENGAVRTADGFAEAYRLFTGHGWNGLDLDPAYGGQGLPRLLSAAVSEMWNGANLSFALCPMLTQCGARLLEHAGTPALRELYLARLVSGEWTATMNLTEPQAGSDLSRVRSRAQRDGDRYRITGQKIFITFGDHDWTDNIIHFVLARLPDAPDGVDGISLFLVPKFLVEPSGRPGGRNDVRCLSLEHKLGIHACPTAVMAYGEDGDGAVGHLIGAENQGLRAMFAMMNEARLAVGIEGVGIAGAAFQQARDYARERIQGRGADGAAEPVAIIEHADVRRMLLSMKARGEAVRSLACFVASQADAAAGGEADAKAMVDLLTPVTKAWSTDTAIAVADTGIQVHGGMGYIEESGAPQFWRDARITAIYEGTNGIQARDLAGRKLRRDGGRAATALIERMRHDLGGAVSPIGAQALAAVGRLAEATSWMVGQDDEAMALAAATPYLRLMGIATGGWLMARSATAAQRRLDAGSGDPAFARARLAAARFYGDNELPQAAALHAVVTGGSGTVLDPASDDI